MSYNSVCRHYVKFHNVWRSNVHDIRKVFLETTLCVYACLSSFMCLFLMKLIWEVLNSYMNVLKFKKYGWKSSRTNQVSLRKDPFLEAKTAKTPRNDGGSRRLAIRSTPRQWESWFSTLAWDKHKTRTILSHKLRTNRMVHWLRDSPLVAIHPWC